MNTTIYLWGVPVRVAKSLCESMRLEASTMLTNPEVTAFEVRNYLDWTADIEAVIHEAEKNKKDSVTLWNVSIASAKDVLGELRLEASKMIVDPEATFDAVIDFLNIGSDIERAIQEAGEEEAEEEKDEDAEPYDATVSAFLNSLRNGNIEPDHLDAYKDKSE